MNHAPEKKSATRLGIGGAKKNIGTEQKPIVDVVLAWRHGGLSEPRLTRFEAPRSSSNTYVHRFPNFDDPSVQVFHGMVSSQARSVHSGFFRPFERHRHSCEFLGWSHLWSEQDVVASLEGGLWRCFAMPISGGGELRTSRVSQRWFVGCDTR